MKFKTIKETFYSQSKIPENIFSNEFTVRSLGDTVNSKWEAEIKCSRTYPDKGFRSIVSSYVDFDPLKAMQLAQDRIFPHISYTEQDIVDNLWNEIVVELEKQFGFPLA